MHEQIEIESIGNEDFGQSGDSGSLVFQKEGNSLTAVGIFEGKVCNTYIVTPILSIKMALSEFMSVYRDPPTDTQMEFEEQISSFTMKLHHIQPSRNSFSVNIDRAEEISRDFNEIQTNILHYTEHSINSVKAEINIVKAEINIVKRHIDDTKKEIIENIGGQMNTLAQAIQSNFQRQ